MWHSEIRRGDSSALTVLRRSLGLPPRSAAYLQIEAFKGFEVVMFIFAIFLQN